MAQSKPFATLSLSMYSSTHPAEHRFPVWWTGDVVYTMLLDNVHKMVNGGLELQVRGFRPFRRRDWPLPTTANHCQHPITKVLAVV